MLPDYHGARSRVKKWIPARHGASSGVKHLSPDLPFPSQACSTDKSVSSNSRLFRSALSPVMPARKRPAAAAAPPGDPPRPQKAPRLKMMPPCKEPGCLGVKGIPKRAQYGCKGYCHAHFTVHHSAQASRQRVTRVKRCCSDCEARAQHRHAETGLLYYRPCFRKRYPELANAVNMRRSFAED